MVFFSSHIAYSFLNVFFCTHCVQLCGMCFSKHIVYSFVLSCVFSFLPSADAMVRAPSNAIEFLHHSHTQTKFHLFEFEFVYVHEDDSPKLSLRIAMTL